ncbi:MAG: linear amide C-N hydrolase [Candidatus Aminicenantes bacterium]|jgi:choloylglycine hydrolase
MKKLLAIAYLVIVLLLFFFSVRQGLPCSTFVLRSGERFVLGHNLDFYTGMGFVVVNKRHVKKVALLYPGEIPVKWVSKYGSITFNQLGKEFPFGGMNEKGLVVEQMWLEESQYPPADGRPALMELQWIQYQFDNCATVDEVIASDKAIRISQNQSTIHYLVCDRSGKVASIEFIGGKFVCHTDGTIPAEVLTNSTYDKSFEYLKEMENNGGEMAPGKFNESMDRFARLAKALKEYKTKQHMPMVDYAFDALSSVSVESETHATQWSIVYNPQKRNIIFRTHKNAKQRTLRIKDFDYSCSSPTEVLNIEQKLEGDVSGHFVEYRTDMNRALIKAAFGHYKSVGFMKDMPEFIMDIMATYPESMKCNNK